MKIAVLQMDCVEGDPDRNRRLVRDAAREAADDGASLLALPELWCSGYDLKSSTRESGHDEMFDWVIELSKEIPLLAGSLLEPHDGKHRNCAIAAESGRELMRYRKSHLFKPLGEDEYLHAGTDAPRVFEIAGLMTAFTICYDLRFPELYIPLIDQGVELICVPAQWPSVRVAHWRALLVARAIECQCYVLGINRRGYFGDLEFPGHSLLIDPKGEIVVGGAETPGVFSGEIEPAAVHQWRTEFPVHADRESDHGGPAG